MDSNTKGQLMEAPPILPSASSSNLASPMGQWSTSHWKKAVFGWLALVVVALAALMLAAVPAKSASSVDRIGPAADAAVRTGVPGVAVYVRDKGHTTVVTRGYDDVRAKRHMNAGDRLRIGSVTKSFVATVALQLVDEGKLSLDDSVDRWLPGLVPNGGAITVRELLSHRSGLFDYVRDKQILAPYLQGHLDHVWTPLQIVRMATKHRPVFAPGTPGRQSYSNTGYVVLGLMIEKVTGHSLAEELNARIFRPLGLDHTSLPASPRIPGRYAHGYTNVLGPTPVDITGLSPSLFWAAGGIVSTPADVARFYRALFQGRLVPMHLIAEMKAAEGRDPEHPEVRYGLGLYRQRLSCGFVWGHNGDIPGYDTTALNSADGARQIVVAVNSDADSLTPAGQKALQRLVDVAYCG